METSKNESTFITYPLNHFTQHGNNSENLMFYGQLRHTEAQLHTVTAALSSRVRLSPLQIVQSGFA